MFPTALARYNPDNTSSWAAAGAAAVATLAVQSLAANAIDPLAAHRGWTVGLAGAGAGAAAAAAVAPPEARVGAAVGTVAGLGVSYGIAMLPLPLWLKAPLAILAIPAGAFAGSKF